MGVDWAFIGENSYTVLVIGAWNPYPTHFDVYYYHVFKGAEADVEFQINEIIRLANQCRINIIGADWGAGHVQNIKLVNALGEHRVAQMWHTGMQGRGKTQRAKWEPKTRKWHLARTAVLTDTYETLRQGRCRLPRAEDCQLMFDHLLAISMEYNEKTNLTQYVHIKPDDCAHALTFAMLAGELLIRGDFGGHGATPTVTPGGVPAPDHPDGWGVSDSYYQ